MDNNSIIAIAAVVQALSALGALAAVFLIDRSVRNREEQRQMNDRQNQIKSVRLASNWVLQAYDVFLSELPKDELLYGHLTAAYKRERFSAAKRLLNQFNIALVGDEQLGDAVINLETTLEEFEQVISRAHGKQAGASVRDGFFDRGDLSDSAAMVRSRASELLNNPVSQ